MVDEDLEVLFDIQLNMSQRVPRWPSRPMASWPVSAIVWPAGAGQGLSPCTQHCQVRVSLPENKWWDKRKFPQVAPGEVQIEYEEKKKSSQELSTIGTGCQGKWWSRHLWRDLKDKYVWQQQEQDPTNLYISNLPVSMDEQELENMLKPFGHVISTRILRDANGVSRGVGFARMESTEKCEVVIQHFNGKYLKTPPGLPGLPVLVQVYQFIEGCMRPIKKQISLAVGHVLLA
ncbi:hypothetical protein DUI87_18415 [Hirundo rustica rustica]|uniref:RRM domain-containing protein n=1 Tax=Hirundo rustica rustica TaxID=333673 RepID=A0A3M0JYI8_HIRRU|nr:hypothetical protein DUI87_18415 [Hirundo rustica rustica]